MHKLDQMTPNERMSAFMKGEPMDRLLTMPILVSIAHRVMGVTHRVKRSSAANQAGAQIACYDRYGNDLMIVEYGLHGVGTALGTKMTDPEDSVPAISEHILKDLADLDQLDFSRCKKENDPWHRLNLEAVKICIKERGQEVPTGVLISGPFTACSSIYPMEKLLRATRKEPENIHRLLRKVTDILKVLYKDYVEAGAIILQCDPIASGTILKSSQYKEFVKPYATELATYITEIGGVHTYHICGDTTKTTKDMVETGCHMLSVDNRVDLALTKEVAGIQVPILGNVDPVGVLLHGNKEEIFAAVKQCILKAWDSPNGYILASGCDITQNVPVENIDTFMEAARLYGKCPINVEQLKK